MATQEDSPGVLNLGVDDQGRSVLLTEYDENLAEKATIKGLNPDTDSDAETRTPDPTDDDAEYDARDGGPIRRFNDIFTDLGNVNLEALGLEGHEVASAYSTLRNEMYRNQFPMLEARFAVACSECGSEYDEELPACPECSQQRAFEAGLDVPADLEQIPEQYWVSNGLREPSKEQKTRIQDLMESVNKEGQSLRELMQLLEDDQSRLGVSAMIVQWEYTVATQDTPAFDAGEIIFEQPDELVRGDPKRIVPVVDEDGRIGGYWWTCPIHREKGVEKHGGFCEECGAELREVYYVEKEHARAKQIAKYYFEDEVITWARHFPRLHGLDGLSPMHLIWLKQSILHWMDVYGAAFYDPQSDRYPNKMMVVHTTNPETWEKNFQRAEDDAKENPYSQQVMVNEYSSESQSTPELQVIDLMSEELLGQDEQLKKAFKQDIRQIYGVTNIFDSETSDAGGLNNEGLQMEVTDRAISSAMKDTTSGALVPLERTLGMTDWTLSFVPSQTTDIDRTHKEVMAGADAVRAGLDASWEDGTLDISDGEFEMPEQPGAGGEAGGLGMGFPMGGEEGGGGMGMGPSSSGGMGLEGPPSESEEMGTAADQFGWFDDDADDAEHGGMEQKATDADADDDGGAAGNP